MLPALTDEFRHLRGSQKIMPDKINTNFFLHPVLPGKKDCDLAFAQQAKLDCRTAKGSGKSPVA